MRLLRASLPTLIVLLVFVLLLAGCGKGGGY
jgi:hypothetical protein